MNIFVGNLSFEATDRDVQKLFEGFGVVTSSVIVMRKEKKVPKSRGFAFVEMPDDAHALAAIAALHGQEFLGRPLDISPARPKPKAHVKRELKEQGKPLLPRPGTYGGGRRTLSYMKRQALAGKPAEPKPRKSFRDNPMRWHKRRDQAKPWHRGPAEHKPWEKSPAEHKPWQKAGGAEHKPWVKNGSAEHKPWQKKGPVEHKPWQKKGPVAHKPWQKKVPKKAGPFR